MSVSPFVSAAAGEIVTSGGTRIQVSINALDAHFCLIGERGLPEGHHDLWIGAVGPLRVFYSAARPDRLQFAGQIHPSIVRHFNAAAVVTAYGRAPQLEIGADVPDGSSRASPDFAPFAQPGEALATGRAAN